MSNDTLTSIADAICIMLGGAAAAALVGIAHAVTVWAVRRHQDARRAKRYRIERNEALGYVGRKGWDEVR